MTCNKVTQSHVVDQFVPTDKLAILPQLVSKSNDDGWTLVYILTYHLAYNDAILTKPDRLMYFQNAF